MAYIDDIQKIARTQEILDLANKVIKDAEQAKKETIGVKRGIAIQGGIGTPGGMQGNNGSGATQTGTNSSGNTVQAPLAPPITPPGNEPVQNIDVGDAYYTSAGNNAIAYQGSNSPQNLSSAGTEVSNTTAAGTGTTRTESAQQAAGTSDDWVTINTAMVAAGATSDEIKAARMKFFGLEPGKHEVGDVYNGDQGPKPETTNHRRDRGSLVSEVLNAIVGVDPDNASLLVEIRFDNKLPTPSVEESATAGQPPWTDGYTPPTDDTWTSGFRVQDTADAEFYVSGSAWFNAYQGLWIDDFPDIELTFVSLPDHWEITSVLAGGTLRGTGAILSCTPGSSGTCPIVGPTLESWPTANLAVLMLTQGTFVGSTFDSEVPLKWQGGVSTVSIQSSVTGDNYTIEQAINGGFMISNESNPEYMLYYGADRSLKTIVPVEQYNFYRPRSN